jgi:hypothetical protein
MPVWVRWSGEYQFGRVEKELMCKEAKSAEVIDGKGKKTDVI